MYLITFVGERNADTAVNAIRFYLSGSGNYAQQGSIHHFKRKLS
jgi:hypothetical protein